MQELIFSIDGVGIEISPETAVTLSKSFSEVQQLGDIISPYSYTFRVLANEKTNEVFGTYWNVNDDGFDPRVKVPAQISAGVQTTLFGHVQMLGVYHQNLIQREYELIFFGEVANVARDIKDKMLSELDYSDLDHTLDQTTFETLIDQSGLSGDLVYTLVDKGQAWTNDGSPNSRPINSTDTDKRNYFADFTPAIRERWLMDKIITEAGYQLTSDFFDTAEFDDKYTLFLNSRYVIGELKAEAQTGALYRLTDQVFTAVAQGSPYGGGTNVQAISGMVESWDLSNNFSGGDTFTAPYAGVFTFQLSSLMTSNINAVLIFFLQVNGAFAYPLNGLSSVQVIIGAGTDELVQYEAPLLLEAGDTVTWNFVRTTTGTAPDITLYGTALYDAWLGTGFKMNFATPPLHNEDVDVSANAPDIKQIDYLRGICRKYNMAVIPDPSHPKGVIIEPIRDLIYTGVTRDWTNKMEAGKDVVDKPTTGLQSRTILLEYTKGTDMISKIVNDVTKVNYGSQLIENPNNEFATGDQKITLPFFPIPCNTVAETDIIIHKSTDPNGQGIFGQPKGGYYSYQPTAVGVGVYNPDTTTVDILTDYPYIGHFQVPNIDFAGYDDNFGVVQPWHNYLGLTELNLFNRFWLPYFNEIYNKEARIRSANVYLTPNEFAELDFRDSIVIKDSIWRVNKVDSYNANGIGTCKVELIKQVITPRSCEFVPYSSAGGLVLFTDEDGVVGFGNETCCEFYGGVWASGINKCFMLNERPDAVVGKDVKPKAETSATKQLGDSLILGNSNIFLSPVVKSVIAGDGHTIEEGVSGSGNLVTGEGTNVSHPGKVNGNCGWSRSGTIPFCFAADLSGGGVNSTVMTLGNGQSTLYLPNNSQMTGFVDLVAMEGGVAYYVRQYCVIVNNAGTTGIQYGPPIYGYFGAYVPLWVIQVNDLGSGAFELLFNTTGVLGAGSIQWAAEWNYILVFQ